MALDEKRKLGCRYNVAHPHSDVCLLPSGTIVSDDCFCASNNGREVMRTVALHEMWKPCCFRKSDHSSRS